MAYKEIFLAVDTLVNILYKLGRLHSYSQWFSAEFSSHQQMSGTHL